jgi:hypothetical protein
MPRESAFTARRGEDHMDGLLVYLDHSDIRPGKVGDVAAAVTGLVDFVEAREPQLLSYGFYIDPAASTMTVVAVHPNSASLELHLTVGGPEFRKVGELIDLRLIEVYGEPSPGVRVQLEEKAAMLGHAARLVIHERTVGFTRLPAPVPQPPLD